MFHDTYILFTFLGKSVTSSILDTGSVSCSLVLTQSVTTKHKSPSDTVDFIKLYQSFKPRWTFFSLLFSKPGWPNKNVYIVSCLFFIKTKQTKIKDTKYYSNEKILEDNDKKIVGLLCFGKKNMSRKPDTASLWEHFHLNIKKFTYN